MEVKGYKRNLAIAYSSYCKYNGIHWIKPKYRPCSKLPKISSEEKVSMLIVNYVKMLMARTASAVAKIP